MLNREKIEANLKTKWLGRNLTLLEDTGSTNADVQQRAAEAEGLVICAESQSAGRGRRGRAWASPPGENLYVSLLLKPPMPPEETPALTLMAGLCVCEVVRELTGLPAGIKWPNDVLCQGKKLSGILTEAAVGEGGLAFAVVGMGVNLNTRAFPPEAGIAGSLWQLTGQDWEREAFLAALLNRLEERYEAFTAGGFAALREGYRALSVTLGKAVDIHAAQPFWGRATDILPDGSLIVETENGPVRVESGEVTLRERKGGES